MKLEDKILIMLNQAQGTSFTSSEIARHMNEPERMVTQTLDSLVDGHTPVERSEKGFMIPNDRPFELIIGMVAFVGVLSLALFI